MTGTAFCPAHITGFFRADRGNTPETTGSVGAGFCITKGVTTTVQLKAGGIPPQGVVEHVVKQFQHIINDANVPLDIRHKMEVPLGYGLGSSGALAFSTALALNEAFGTKLDRETLGQMAHRAEIHHNSGLGDVLAAYTGGFEIRTKPGAPGYGSICRVQIGDPAVLIFCLAPRKTSEILGSPDLINGIGGSMVQYLLAHPDAALLQRLSMEFAQKSGMLSSTVNEVVDRLHDIGVSCGIAMLGETVFTILPTQKANSVIEAMGEYEIISAGIEYRGAHVLQ